MVAPPAAAEAIEPGHVLLIGADAIFGGAVVDAEDHLLVELAPSGMASLLQSEESRRRFHMGRSGLFIAIETLNLATVNLAVVVAVVFIQLALVRNIVLVAVLALTKVDVASIRNAVAVAVGIALIGRPLSQSKLNPSAMCRRSESVGCTGGAKVVQEEAGW